MEAIQAANFGGLILSCPRVLDEEWQNTFRRSYPDFRSHEQAKKAA
jgi:hypothetical protein